MCGGGGCGRCGGPSCDNGAVTKADNALDFAMKAEEILKAKEGKAKGVHMNVSFFITLFHHGNRLRSLTGLIWS